MSDSDTETLETELTENLQISSEDTKPALPGTKPVDGVQYPLKVQYCGECTMPLEYCSFSGRYEQCQAWRKKNIDALAADGIQIAVDDDTVEEKKHQKRGGKGQAKSAVKVSNF